MARTQKTAPCTPQEASKRAAIAAAYLESAELAMAERDELNEEQLSVAAGATETDRVGLIDLMRSAPSSLSLQVVGEGADLADKSPDSGYRSEAEVRIRSSRRAR
jgi:hypothetical protein